VEASPKIDGSDFSPLLICQNCTLYSLLHDPSGSKWNVDGKGTLALAVVPQDGMVHLILGEAKPKATNRPLLVQKTSAEEADALKQGKLPDTPLLNRKTSEQRVDAMRMQFKSADEGLKARRALRQKTSTNVAISEEIFPKTFFNRQGKAEVCVNYCLCLTFCCCLR